MSLLKRIEQGQGTTPQTPADEAANKARVSSLQARRVVAPGVASQRDTYIDLMTRVQNRLLAELEPSMVISKVNEVRTTIQELFEQVLAEENIVLSRPERHGLYEQIAAEILGFGPLQPLLDDENITEVMVNGAKNIYVERGGKLHRVPMTFESDDHVMRIIDRIVAPLGRRIDESSPYVDARLPDGSRVNAVIPPISLDWVMKQSEALVSAAEKLAQRTCGRGIEPIRSTLERKEALAHDRQKARGLGEGLIGVWSSVEAACTYRACYDAEAGFPQLGREFGRCKHLYFYYDHPQYGFASVRLQTWFPYGIQIALNGREWLRRDLDKHRIAYVAHGNKFLHIADYGRAQRLLVAQNDARWAKLLESFLPQVFPTMMQTLGPRLRYYWTLWQSEWATDYIFEQPATVAPLMDGLSAHPG